MEPYKAEHPISDTESHVQSEVELPDVNTTEGRDEILRRAVEAERPKLRITPGQLATLRQVKKGEEILNG